MDIEQILRAYHRNDDPEKIFDVARQLEADGELEQAATAYDRAYGLAPEHEGIQRARATLLDRLAIVEHGIVFRYIPAGTFLMGSEAGDPDESPVHPVQLDAYWLSETPISWAKFCELMDFQPPPNGMPGKDWESKQSGEWVQQVMNLIPVDLREPELWSSALNAYPHLCLQYCESETIRARDWHAHVPTMEWKNHEGKVQTSADIFGLPPRTNADSIYTYDEKPIVGIQYEGAFAVGLRMSTKNTQYRLPTEAEWEKGARGGLIGATYPWGDTLPTHDNCDFGRFKEFSIQKSKSFPANGYGLYAMCGGVWEWTSDWYAAEYYTPHLQKNPTGSEQGEAHVLRGGSWADDAEAVTVSYRMAGEYHISATVGFRLCRVKRL